MIVLPQDSIEELSSLPPSVASPHGALEHDLLGPYTGLNLILESRMHHSIVQRKLTPRLGVLTPGLEQELVSALEDNFPSCTEWTEIKPYQLLARISARLSARTLVGPSLSRNEQWLDISVNYVENLFRTIVILRHFPTWVHPFLYRLLPSFWRCNAYIRSAKALLGPKIDDLLRKGELKSWTPAQDDDSSVLAWLADAAKGKDRNPDVLAHVEVLLALASVHTTLLRMVNVLNDLIANPDHFSELRIEIDDVRQNGWNPSSYSSLRKLDSVLRESQRMSPPTTLGMKRLFKSSYTFSNGIEVPKDAYVCLPTFAIENDAEHTASPEIFDGLRSYRLRQRKEEADLHQFTSTEPTVLNFGYGKSACPGRFFAGLMLKIVFVKLLSEYEFSFPTGGGRPKNLQLHEFLFPWPWDKILIRKRGETAPF